MMQIEKINPNKTNLSKSSEIQTGEIYGKQTNTKFVMYSVLKVAKGVVTLQNIDNPLSLFETTGQKLYSSGYIRISQTPYINPNITGTKKGKGARKRERARRQRSCRGTETRRPAEPRPRRTSRLRQDPGPPLP